MFTHRQALLVSLGKSHSFSRTELPSIRVERNVFAAMVLSKPWEVLSMSLSDADQEAQRHTPLYDKESW